MGTLKLSIKRLKQLHQNIGGNAGGFYVIAFGHCVYTGQSISADIYIAAAQKSVANWSYWLVKGRKDD